MSTENVTRNIYTKWCNGDTLSNKEVLHGSQHFRQMADMLYQSGPAFVIAAKEANRVAIALNDVATARKLTS